MLRSLVLVALFLGSVALGSRGSAKELEPVEAGKAQKVVFQAGAQVAPPAKAGLPRKAQKARSPKTIEATADKWTKLPVSLLKFGQTGVLVEREIDSGFPGGWIALRQFAVFRVVSIVDGSNVIAEWSAHDDRELVQNIRLCLKGFSTKGVVDDDILIIPWVVNVTGTTKWAGITMLLIEPRLETAEEREAKARAAQTKQGEEEAELERKAAAEKALWRVWTDASRAHSVEAQFKGLVGGQVKLVKKDGTKISIPLEGLSEEDQGWILKRGKQ